MSFPCHFQFIQCLISCASVSEFSFLQNFYARPPEDSTFLFNFFLILAFYMLHAQNPLEFHLSLCKHAFVKLGCSNSFIQRSKSFLMGPQLTLLHYSCLQILHYSCFNYAFYEQCSLAFWAYSLLLLWLLFSLDCLLLDSCSSWIWSAPLLSPLEPAVLMDVSIFFWSKDQANKRRFHSLEWSPA